MTATFSRLQACLPAIALALAWPLSAAGEPLRSARAVRELAAGQAAQGRETELEGVVLGLVDPRGTAFVMQDETDPIYVSGAAEAVAALAPGDRVQVHGRTDPGGYAPVVRADVIRKTGIGEIPPPARVSPRELFSNGLDAKWITLTGIIHHIRDAGPDPMRQAGEAGRESRRIELSLAIGDRVVPVLFYGWLDRDALLDAEVEINGLCFSQHNVDRQFLNPSLFIARAADIRILQSARHGPFEEPAVSARSLFTFKRAGISLHRVHMDGVVLHQPAGSGLWIRDDGTGLFVQTEGAARLAPGDRVQVAGYPQRGRFSPVLADAICRRIGHGAEPLPTPLSVDATIAQHDGDLVTLTGSLTAQKENSDGTVYRVEWSGREIAAVYQPHAGEPAPQLAIGSEVAVTGICVGGSSPPDAPVAGVLMPDTFSLLLRRPGDIAVVRAAPWWNGRRVAQALWTIIAALAAVLVAVFRISRRRLARAQAQRARESAEYGARLAERSRMARELHDTLAQGLGAISLQLQLAASGAPAPAGAKDAHLTLAHELVRTSMLEVRSFIRNLRTHTQQDVDLARALGELLATAIEGTRIKSTFRTEGDARKFPAAIEAQVIRIVQEAMANAIRHSQGDAIAVTVCYAPHELVVTIEDTGNGFDPAAAGDGLHFGLLGMKERAALISAALTIATSPGRGVRIRLAVPNDAVVRDSLSL